MTQLPRAAVLFGCSLLVGVANATTIDFEMQGAGAPPAFSGILNSPLTIGIATFSGGQLLRNEAGGADLTAIYATTDRQTGAYADPLVISFSQPVSNVSVLLTDEIPDTYKLADNTGVSTSHGVNGNTSVLFNLADSATQQVVISSATTTIWDFAINNVTFTPSSTAVPEPPIAYSAAIFLSLLVWRHRTCPLKPKTKRDA